MCGAGQVQPSLYLIVSSPALSRASLEKASEKTKVRNCEIIKVKYLCVICISTCHLW